MTNVINFPSGKQNWDSSQPAPDLESPKSVRQSYAEQMAMDLFQKTMMTIEGTGVFDALLEADDVGFAEIQPRLILLKEAMLSVFLFLEAEQHELDGVANALFNIQGMDHETLELVGNYNDKYLQMLHTVTENFNNDVNND